MNIFGFLKRIKAPSFEEEFIRDPAERLIEEGKAGKTGRLPVKLDVEVDRKRLQEWMDEQNDHHTNPGDAACPYFE